MNTQYILTLLSIRKYQNTLQLTIRKKQYANGKIHVNNCENRHSLIKPFLKMFRGVSKKYLEGYVMLYQYIFNYKEDAADKILETILKNAT